MNFSIVSQKTGLVLGSDLDASAPAIQLKEGAPHAGMKRPLALAPGEHTIVAYPLFSFERDAKKGDVVSQLVCKVTRTDDAGLAGFIPAPSIESPSPIVVSNIEPIARRRRAVRPT